MYDRSDKVTTGLISSELTNHTIISPRGSSPLSTSKSNSKLSSNSSIRQRAQIFEGRSVSAHSTSKPQHFHLEQKRNEKQKMQPQTSSNSQKVEGNNSSPGIKPSRSYRSSRSPVSKSPAAKSNNNKLSAQTSNNKSNSSQQKSVVQPQKKNQSEDDNTAEDAVVTPELLVDALSGHEDGLLAIAERLMEHYDGGYDVMGEAIIDAFADVQKLFQHVVEAAHMEGAAFESSRREAEQKQHQQQQPYVNGTSGGDSNKIDVSGGVPIEGMGAAGALTRHEEFIDQDVRDILSDAIRQGQQKKDAGKHMECYELYEEACNSASALLPVDSDHRGRLQLSIARAESMSPERACSILRYAMDDVLRSGQNLRTHKNPDPSKRGDCVLKPPAGPRSPSSIPISGVATQSHEEALASLVEEMKEVLSAPVYENTPVQEVAIRFWGALEEAQKNGKKREEMLESELGRLKGEFLLARAEWEEKFNNESNQSETFKKKYYTLKDQVQQHQFMNHARSSAQRIAQKEQKGMNSVFSADTSDGLCSGSVARWSPKSNAKILDKDIGPNSVASFGSVLGHHARTLVGTLGCHAIGGGETKDRGRSGTPETTSSESSPPPSAVSSNSRRSSHLPSWNKGTSKIRGSSNEKLKYPNHGLGKNDV